MVGKTLLLLTLLAAVATAQIWTTTTQGTNGTETPPANGTTSSEATTTDVTETPQANGTITWESTTSTETTPTTTAPPPDPLTKAWESYDLGEGIGAQGYITTDVNGDGKQDLVVATNRGKSVMVVAYNAAAATYEIIDRLEKSFDYNIQGLGHVVDQSGVPRFGIVITTSYELVFFDLASIKEVYVAQLDSRAAIPRFITGAAVLPPSPVPKALLVQGSQVLSCSLSENDDGEYLYDQETFDLGLEFSTGAFGAFTAANKRELVFANGAMFEFSPIFGFVPVEGFQFQLASGSHITTVDIEEDGILEVVGFTGGRIYAYSAVDKSILWSHDPEYSIEALNAFDADGDGDSDVVYGDDQWGAIHAIDATDGTEIASVQNPEHGTTFVAGADFDGDGTVEVTFGAGYSSSGSDHLFIGRFSDGTITWQSRDLDPPYSVIALGARDDSPLQPYLLYASGASNSGYSESVVVCVDVATGVERFSFEIEGFADSVGSLAVAGDILNTGADVILVGIHNYVSDPGTVYFYSAIDGSRLPEVLTVATVEGSISALLVSDLDSDGVDDIVFAGQAVYIVNGESPTVVADSSPAIAQFEALAAADLDLSGVKEVYALTGAGQVWRYDVETGHMSLVDTGDVTPTSLTSTTADQIAIGTSEGSVHRFDADGLSSKSVKVCDGPVLHLSPLLDLEVAFSCGNALGSVYLDDRVVARTDVTEVSAVGAVAAANLPLEVVYVTGSNDYAMMFKSVK